MIATRSSKPPKAPLPAGQRWVCHGYRPVTGQPKHADGRLIICWEWEPSGKVAPDPVEAAPPPTVRRGLAQFAQQSELPL